MTADVRITGLDDAMSDLAAGLDRELQQGMLRAAQAVAEEAASDHAYTNRTGALQAGTQAGGTRGSAMSGELIAEVVGETEYGEYVDNNPEFAFLAPAAERADDRLADIIDEALERAAQRAGWT